MKGTDDKHVNKRSYLETVFGGVLVRICGGKEQLQRNTQQGTTLIVKVPYINRKALSHTRQAQSSIKTIDSLSLSKGYYFKLESASYSPHMN